MINKNRILKKIILTSIVVMGLFLYEHASKHSIDRFITFMFCKKLNANLAQSFFGEIYIIIEKDTYISKVRYLASKTESASEEKIVDVKAIVDINSFTKTEEESSNLYFNDIKYEYVFYDTESPFIIVYPKLVN